MKRILLVHPDPAAAGRIVARAPARCRVTTANSALAALRLARALRPDCVLIATHLPDLPAVELWRRLTREAPSLPALLLAPADRMEDATPALLAGMDGFLVEDHLSPGILARALTEAMAQRRAS